MRVSRQRTEALVATHVAALFDRLPMLCGFSVRPDLDVIEVTISTWPGHDADAELHDALAHALAELADEGPDAVQLLRGRTFARSFH